MNLTDAYWGLWEEKIFLDLLLKQPVIGIILSLKLSFACKKGDVVWKIVSEIKLEFHFKRLLIK